MIRLMNRHPTRLAVIVLAIVLVPVWYLTGDWSPLP